MFARGVRRFIIGLGKKVLIANIVAVPADQIFTIAGDQLTMGLAWLGVLCYALQIYFDFSGYSDMAIGLGLMFGFRFLENFQLSLHRPTRSPSSGGAGTFRCPTWFRDYLYIPLGGNRVAPWRVYLNLVIVFFLCGLWHGASWNFVVWGLFHGELSGRRARRARASHGENARGRLLRHVYVMLVVWWLGVLPCRFAAGGRPFLHAMAGMSEPSGLDHPSPCTPTRRSCIALVGRYNRFHPGCARRSGAGGRRRAGGGSQIGSGVGRARCADLLLSGVDHELAAGTYNPFIYFRF